MDKRTTSETYNINSSSVINSNTITPVIERNTEEEEEYYNSNDENTEVMITAVNTNKNVVVAPGTTISSTTTSNMNTGNANGNEKSSTSSSSSSSNTELPQVLTRSTIPTINIVTLLDASDVIECYYLTRETTLYGMDNIKITKSALGLRYRPRFFDTTDEVEHENEKYWKKRTSNKLELTIEYGPTRVGDDVLQESVPILYNNNQAITWENEAKIYYTEKIHTNWYTSANYLTSISGVIVTKLLNNALDYIDDNKIHRRYQPFVVYNNNNNNENNEKNEKLLLKSSNDIDFIQSMYELLAQLGVQLQPVILPTTYQLSFIASSVEKVQVSNENVAEFYTNLYNCIHAIANATYTNPTTKTSTSTSTITNTTTTTTTTPVQTISPHYNNNNDNTTATNMTYDNTESTTVSPTMSPSSVRRRRRKNKSKRNLKLVTLPEDVETKFPKHQQLDNDQDDNDDDDEILMNEDWNDHVDEFDDFDNNEGDESSTVIPSTTIAPTSSDSNVVDDADNDVVVDHTEEAAQAANEAQQYAQQAGQASNHEEAIDAAQKAADAAQKAATATVNQAASIAKDAIKSGDGNIVTSTIYTSCWNVDNDDRYQLYKTAYIYWDGIFYYKLNNVTNLTIRAIPTTQLPQPPIVGFQKEDFIDWTISILICIATIFGFTLIIQHVSGKKIYSKRMYRCQKWFFHPTKFTYTVDNNTNNSNHKIMIDDESESTRGGGHEYTFGEDVIPLSMGGKRSFFHTNTRTDRAAETWLHSKTNKPIDNILGDLEMVEHNNNNNNNNSMNNSRNNSYVRNSSFHSSIDGDDNNIITADDFDDDGNIVLYHSDDDEVSTLESAPDRLFRDPDLVDLPDLKSKSKIAMPVRANSNGTK